MVLDPRLWHWRGLVAEIDLHISWEVDPDCIAILQQHYPRALHRGNFLDDDPRDVADLIRRHDPTGSMVVSFVAAPPCPDFSRIKEDAPGSNGTEGQKFTAYCGFANQVEMNIPHRRVGHLVENVVMEKGEADYFASLLDCNAVLLDAQDLGLISRPRLWWTRIDWGVIKHSPFTGTRLKWTRTQKYYRLHQDGPKHDISQLELDGMELHQRVRSQETRIPCLTTPAPSEAGRPPPKRMRGKIHPEQKMRWMNDGRNFAPWQYAEEALLHDASGAMHVPPAKAKEQYHQLPIGYTDCPGVSDRARHRILANGWHIGSAKFMMMLVLQAVLTLTSAEVPQTPRTSPLQYTVQLLNTFPPSVGPGRWAMEPTCVPQAQSLWHHWEMACQATHPMCRPPSLEPGLQQCIDLRQIVGGSLGRLRTEVVDEIAAMAEERMDETIQWWQQLAPHVAPVYYNKQHDEISQIPLLVELLQLTRMPGLPDLATDLQHGFEITGVLNPGPGWLPRADQRYEFPVSDEAFHQHNRHYTLAKLKSGRIDSEWQTMVTELREELNKGRMSGPFSAPSWWPVPAISIEGRSLQNIPDDNSTFSFCFSVKQTDKIRRCEDFRRSGHNSTVVAHDTPHHHDVKTLAELGLIQSMSHGSTLSWAQDLLGAYRQISCTHTSQVLLRHFDATGSSDPTAPCIGLRIHRVRMGVQQSGRWVDVPGT